MDAYFDLETTGLADADDVTVGVVKLVGEGLADEYRIFHSGFGKPLAEEEVGKLLDCLARARTVYSFNGGGFDFRMLARGKHAAAAAALAHAHTDVMFDFATSHGYYTAMSSFSNDVAKSNTGEWATTAWFDGHAQEVIDYCRTDVDVLHALVKRGLETGTLDRTTKRGNTNRWVLHGSIQSAPVFRPVSACLAGLRTSPPDTSWMTDPPDIAAALGWMSPYITPE